MVEVATWGRCACSRETIDGINCILCMMQAASAHKSKQKVLKSSTHRGLPRTAIFRLVESHPGVASALSGGGAHRRCAGAADLAALLRHMLA